jgi:ferredoxin
MECFNSCPRSSIQLSPGFKPAPWREYDPSRRQVLLSAGAALAGLALLRVESRARRDDSFLIRPPGALENKLLTKCVRCAECMKVCPTNALQPALFESGVEGAFSPRLIAHLGYCEYNCTLCAQVCPTGAIALLPLPVKQKFIMGKAVFMRPDTLSVTNAAGEEHVGGLSRLDLQVALQRAHHRRRVLAPGGLVLAPERADEPLHLAGIALGLLRQGPDRARVVGGTGRGEEQGEDRRAHGRTSG